MNKVLLSFVLVLISSLALSSERYTGVYNNVGKCNLSVDHLGNGEKLITITGVIDGHWPWRSRTISFKMKLKEGVTTISTKSHFDQEFGDLNIEYNDDIDIWIKDNTPMAYTINSMAIAKYYRTMFQYEGSLEMAYYYAKNLLGIKTKSKFEKTHTCKF